MDLGGALPVILFHRGDHLAHAGWAPPAAAWRTRLESASPRDVMLDPNVLESFAFAQGPVCTRVGRGVEAVGQIHTSKVRLTRQYNT